MKRIGNIYDKIISLDNLRLADEKARRGKSRSYGVKLHDQRREQNLLELHKALKNKTFTTSPYDIFTIRTTKERQIYRLPYYPDRIVHHAIMNVLEPIWGKVLTHNTFSCIKGRGIHACAQYVTKLIRKYDGKPLYCLKIDVQKFYPSVNHSVLKNIVRKKIKDTDALWLLDNIIDSTDGLPIGNYISQPLANLLLAYFMHQVNEKMHLDCVQYADDIVFFHSDKAALHNIFRTEIMPYFENVLKLHIKGNWQIFPIAYHRHDRHGRALDYVGFCFYRKQRLIRKRIKQNLAKAAKRAVTLYHTPKGLRSALAPWLGWCKYSNSKHLLTKLITPFDYESILRPTPKRV